MAVRCWVVRKECSSTWLFGKPVLPSCISRGLSCKEPSSCRSAFLHQWQSGPKFSCFCLPYLRTLSFRCLTWYFEGDLFVWWGVSQSVHLFLFLLLSMVLQCALQLFLVLHLLLGSTKLCLGLWFHPSDLLLLGNTAIGLVIKLLVMGGLMGQFGLVLGALRFDLLLPIVFVAIAFEALDLHWLRVV